MPTRAPCVALALGLAQLAPAPLVAEGVSLPVEVQLPEGGVAIFLNRATVQLRIDATVDSPSLRVRGLSAEASGSIDVVQRGERLELSRADEAGEGPVLIEGVLRPGQRVQIEGSAVEVTLRQVRVAGKLPSSPDTRRLQRSVRGPSEAEDAGPVFKLKLVDSETHLAGLGPSSLELEGGSAELNGLRGALALSSVEAVVAVADQRGTIVLESQGGEVRVEDQRGDLQFSASGTDLDVFGGSGALSGHLDEGYLRAEGRTGKTELRGVGATLELRGLEGEAGLHGRELVVTVEELGGALDLKLAGGILNGSGLRGPVKLNATAGSVVELADLTGGVELILGDSEARLQAVSSLLKAEVHGGIFEVDGAEILAIVASGSEIGGENIARLQTVDVTDSRLQLQLQALINHPTLRLKGQSSGVVYLRVPCAVRMANRQADSESRLRLSGCELDVPGRRSRGRIERLDGGRGSGISVSLEGDSSLDVRGS